VADTEALHDGEGPAAQTQEMPCGGPADHPAADDDDPIRSIDHVCGPFRVPRIAAWPSAELSHFAMTAPLSPITAHPHVAGTDAPNTVAETDETNSCKASGTTMTVTP
jgi:hypothetical protein